MTPETTHPATLPAENAQKPTKEALQADLVARAYKYYLKDLTAAEIGKLLSRSLRTVQRLITENDFAGRAKPKDRAEKVTELHAKGLCPAAIARALSLSRTTVYKYLNAPPAE